MTVLVAVVVSLFFNGPTVGIAPGSAAVTPCHTGLWSANACQLTSSDDAVPSSVCSEDRRSCVTRLAGTAVVQFDGFASEIGILPFSEVLLAPGHRQCAITLGEAPGNSNWMTWVFRLEGESIRRIDVGEWAKKHVADEALSGPSCPEWLFDVVALMWGDSPEQIWIGIVVPPRILDCENGWVTRVYLVDYVRLTVLAEMSVGEFRRKYPRALGRLGPSLADRVERSGGDGRHRP